MSNKMEKTCCISTLVFTERESAEQEQIDAWKDKKKKKMNHGGKSTEAHEVTEVREAILSQHDHQ